MKQYIAIYKRQIFLLSITFLVLLINISLIFNDSVWYDEAYTMNLIRGDFGEILHGAMIDVHPPLYYFIVKTFTLIGGYSVPIAKLASILPFFLTCLLVIFIVDRRMSTDGSQALLGTISFLLLIGLMPCSMNENVELRMYSWAMFFITAMGVYAYEVFLNSSKKLNWILLAVFAVAAAYTHYFAFIAAFIIYAALFLLCLFFRKKLLKPLLGICLISLVCYLPWVPVLIQQTKTVKEGFWIPEVTFSKIIDYLNWLFSGNFNYFWWITITFIVLLIINGFLSLKKCTQMEKGNLVFLTCCFLVFTGLIAAGFILSRLIRPIFVERYIYVTVGLLFIFISYTFTAFINDRRIYCLFLSLVLCTGLMNFNSKRIAEYDTGTEESKTVFAENIPAGSPLFTNDYLLSKWDGSPLLYYMPESTVTLLSSDNDLQKVSHLSEFWYFCSGDIDEAFFENHGYKSEWVYSGNIDNNHYFTLYRIYKD